MLLRQIEYYQAVVETGNFYEAGDRCHVSQSAISQQIRKLEDELGVRLLDRHNRTFSLTPAGEHFYHKSLVIAGDIAQMVRQTQRIAHQNDVPLRIGCYKGYHGSAFSKAIAAFSAQYPAIEVKVILGGHDELYHAMENGELDLALNDQRRAFSGAYHNVILGTSRLYIEVSDNNPLSRLTSIEVQELRNTPCVLITSWAGQREEQSYYKDIVGIQGEFLFADSPQEARLSVVTGRGYLPVDVVGELPAPDAGICRLPLLRSGIPIEKNYCAFWRVDNAGEYTEEFARMLQTQFAMHDRMTP